MIIPLFTSIFMPKTLQTGESGYYSYFYRSKIILFLLKTLQMRGRMFLMKDVVIILLTVFANLFFAHSQASNNQCASAIELCPNATISATNIGANTTFCTGCEDDFNFCFATDNTIWFTFTTNATGGDVQIDFSNLLFQSNPGQDNAIQATIIQAAAPCSANSYAAIGNCVSNGTANFSLNAVGLAANTLFYVVVDGDNTGAGITSPAECTFDISISGTGVDHLPPSVAISSSSLSICKNDIVLFNASTVNCPNNSDFKWYVNGILVAVTTDSTFSYSALMNGDVVSVETSCYTLCTEVVSNATPPFSVYSFTVNAGNDVTTYCGIATTINGVTSAPVYSWSPSYLFSDPNSLNTIVTTDQSITLTLTATENGCTLSDNLTITILSDLDIPNTFSPNGDGTNEKWIIQGIESYPDCSMKIYTRWGQEIYFANGYNVEKAWDGSKRSGLAAEGVYFYILDLGDGKSPLLKGTITLIR